MPVDVSGQVPQRPPGNPIMRMQWRDLLFMHWRVPVNVLRPLIPESLAIDEYEGSAWVGLIPFTMRDVLYDQLPRWPLLSSVPAISAFHECNVRTYVTPKNRSSNEGAVDEPQVQGEPGGPGVWFFSLDAASRPAVWAARKFFHLPYFYAKMHLDRRGDVVRYAVDRVDSPQAKMRCTWRAGEPLPQSQPGDLAHFLTERYALYTTNSASALHQCRIWHEPWSLRSAALISLDDELVRAAGINIDQSQTPMLHHADELNMNAWKLERV